MKTNHDDAFPEAYDAENASSLVNAHYERPAMIALAGDVRGRRILEAGCGSGPLSAALRERGAEMSGFDGSSAIIELARRRLGVGVPLEVADLAEPLPCDDESFDDIVASLVLHYLEDWSGPLAELRRVLKPGGRLIVSARLTRRAAGAAAPGAPERREERVPVLPVPRPREELTSAYDSSSYMNSRSSCGHRHAAAIRCAQGSASSRVGTSMIVKPPSKGG